MLMHSYRQLRYTVAGMNPGWWVMRAMWLIFAVGHLPPLLVRMANPSEMLAGLPLLLAEIYFVLKVVDVPWLRLPRTRQAWIAFAVIVVLLHAPVLTTVVMHADEVPWHLALAPLLVLLTIEWRPVTHLVDSPLRRIRQHVLHRWRWLSSMAHLELLPDRNTDLALVRISPHAPPARVRA